MLYYQAATSGELQSMTSDQHKKSLYAAGFQIGPRLDE